MSSSSVADRLALAQHSSIKTVEAEAGNRETRNIQGLERVSTLQDEQNMYESDGVRIGVRGTMPLELLRAVRLI